MHRVRMVKHFGVTPYLVFDGDFLPSKARTESSRSKRREDSRKAGLELLKAGKPSQAQLELQKAIDISPEMARHLIEELKKEGVPYVVAPYEADAQLVYLERHGLISGIITEDSDLLVFGAKRLLTKLDPYGNCVEVNRRDFCAVREISLTGWTDDQFRQMAIFSGCDYLEGVGNIGLKTAYRMLRKYKTPERMIRMLQFDGKYKVSENYLAQFKQAELTFIYQRVFCPNKRELVLLTEPHTTSPPDIEEMPYIGGRVDPELARAIAVGDVNPISKERIIVTALPDPRNKSAPASATLAPAPQGRQPAWKSIDSFFKGHQRIPMGEMDRNCFSVDPKKVAALTANGLTPRIFPLPRPYLDDAEVSPAPRPYRRRTEPVSRTLSELDPSINVASSRRQTTGSGRRISDVEARPPKKARLCEDVVDDNHDQKAKSKFFSTGNPSVEPADETLLTSDDSVVEALADLPDLSNNWHPSRAARVQQPLQIFQDEDKLTDVPAVQDTCSKDDETSATSSAENETASNDASGRPVVDVQSTGDSTTGSSRRTSVKEFTYTPSVPKSLSKTRMAFGLPTPASSAQGSTRKSLPSTPTDTPFQTPLQRIGAAALRRQKINSSPSTKAKASFVAPKKRHSLAESLDNFPVNAAFVPLPKVDLEEVEALNKPGGSEDQIIPDSDEENEPPTEKTDSQHHLSSRLDLSRFLYC